MKKFIVLLIAVFLITALLLRKGDSVQKVGEAPAAPAPVASFEPAPVHTAEPEHVDVVAQAMAKAKSMSALERVYIDQDSREWEQDLARSEHAVQARGLIEKSTRGTLTGEEAVTLVTEMRRQHVLATLITKEKVEQLKRDYL